MRLRSRNLSRLYTLREWNTQHLVAILDRILLLTAILTVADTRVSVLKMRGVVAIMITRIAVMMGGMMTGPSATEKERGTTVIFTMTIGFTCQGIHLWLTTGV